MRTRSGQKYVEERPQSPQKSKLKTNEEIETKTKSNIKSVKNPELKTKSPKKAVISVPKPKPTTDHKKEELELLATAKRGRRGRKEVVESPPKEIPKRETRTRSTRRGVANEETEIETKSTKKVAKSEEKVNKELNEKSVPKVDKTEDITEEEEKPNKRSTRRREVIPPVAKKVEKPKRNKKEVIETTTEEIIEKSLVSQEVNEEKNEEKMEETPEPIIESMETEDKEKIVSEDKEQEEEEEVTEIMDLNESSSLKRKETESLESAKRLRVSLLSVPTIPQICGKLYSFGTEIAGELGRRLNRINETKVKSNEPSIVTDKDGKPMDNMVAIVCGAMHSCCLRADGKVVTFGCNDDGALGRETDADETEDSIEDTEETECRTPRVVAGLSEVVKVTAGDMHTCALTKEGTVYIWGNFKDESKKFGLFVDTILMDGSDDFSATTLPKLVSLDTKIVDIASGCHHILLLTEDGDVLSFGEGSKGQLGRIEKSDLQLISKKRNLFLEPKKVEFAETLVVDKIWANHWSSYVRSTSGDIYVFGLNNYHQLGFRSSGSVELTNEDPNESQTTLKWIIELKPLKVDLMPKNIVSVCNGQHHMVALTVDGQVWCCGSGTYGKLGFKLEDNNTDKTVETLKFIGKDVFGGEDVTDITCGEFCAAAITKSGQLYFWGQGSNHIGSSDEFVDFEEPTRLKGMVAEKNRFVSVSCGSQHTLALGNEWTLNGN